MLVDSETRIMNKVLLIGYGNVDREDDGVAWHILRSISKQLDRSIPDTIDDEFINTGEPPDVIFLLQLTPEIAETIAQYDYICFIDAHTGSIPEDIQFIEISPEFKPSPLTHHLTPETCMSLTEMMYNSSPKAILVSVKGYQFNFKHGLSHKTRTLAELASKKILHWIQFNV